MKKKKVVDDLRPLAEEVAAAAREDEQRYACHHDEHGEADHVHDVPDLTPEKLQAGLALAARLQEAIIGRPWQIEAIGQEFEVDLEDWLSELCFSLAKQGKADQALAMHGAWAQLTGDDAMLGDRALLLVAAGRLEEAVALAERAVAAQPKDLYAKAHLADVLTRVGRPGEAEPLLRPLSEQAEDWELRLLACDGLVDVLRAQGREEEAVAMEAQLEGDIEDEEE